MRDTLEKEKRRIQDLENRLTKQTEVWLSEMRGPSMVPADPAPQALRSGSQIQILLLLCDFREVAHCLWAPAFPHMKYSPLHSVTRHNIGYNTQTDARGVSCMCQLLAQKCRGGGRIRTQNSQTVHLHLPLPLHFSLV